MGSLRMNYVETTKHATAAKCLRAMLTDPSVSTVERVLSELSAQTQVFVFGFGDTASTGCSVFDCRTRWHVRFRRESASGREESSPRQQPRSGLVFTLRSSVRGRKRSSRRTLQSTQRKPPNATLLMNKVFCNHVASSRFYSRCCSDPVTWHHTCLIHRKLFSLAYIQYTSDRLVGENIKMKLIAGDPSVCSLTVVDLLSFVSRIRETLFPEGLCKL